MYSIMQCVINKDRMLNSMRELQNQLYKFNVKFYLLLLHYCVVRPINREQPSPVGAAGRGEQIYGGCRADGAPGGGDWRRVGGGEGGPLGELLEPLFLRRSSRFVQAVTSVAGAADPKTTGSTFRALSRACSSSSAACLSRSSTLVKDIPVLASDETALDRVLALWAGGRAILTLLC